ncbi:hypothetical protein F5B18DRAFT_621650 [Nemania serpens]|nr:hypothetical protein F5B18DRAFT_621650 [Nemania serpens]
MRKQGGFGGKHAHICLGLLLIFVVLSTNSVRRRIQCDTVIRNRTFWETPPSARSLRARHVSSSRMMLVYRLKIGICEGDQFVVY